MLACYSAESKDLLMKLINPNPDYRPSAETALQHKWFNTDKKALKSSLYINTQLCKLSTNVILSREALDYYKVSPAPLSGEAKSLIKNSDDIFFNSNNFNGA